MRGTKDPDFKLALLQVFKISEPVEIRETCEAIRQMYQADLIDVIADTVDQDRQSVPYKAASKFIQVTMLDLIHLYVVLVQDFDFTTFSMMVLSFLDPQLYKHKNVDFGWNLEFVVSLITNLVYYVLSTLEKNLVLGHDSKLSTGVKV